MDNLSIHHGSRMVARTSALVIGLAGLLVAFQRRSRMALGVTVLCLLLGLASFVTGTNVPVGVEAQSNPSFEASNNTPISQVELGRQLFIAKGCVTCHVNTKVEKVSTHWTIDMGAPNLSMFSADPDYLQKWLFKPAAIKPATQMPDLNLSENEIQALVAFINSK